MAQKPVKKTAAKKAPAKKAVAPKVTVKKAPVKKSTAPKPAVKKAPVKKTAAVKTVAAPAPTAKAAVEPVATNTTPCAHGCKCKCGGFGRFVKKLIVFLVIFGLGFAAATFCLDGKHGFRKGMHMPAFVNGCLDTTKVKCPEMANKITAMDANNDGCITRDEFRAFKKEMRKGGECGCKGCDKSDNND